MALNGERKVARNEHEQTERGKTRLFHSCLFAFIRGSYAVETLLLLPRYRLRWPCAW